MTTRSRARVTETLPALFPEVFPGHPDEQPLEVPPLTPEAQRQVTDLLASGDFDGWSEALARVGNCVRPIRLHGHSQTIDTATGEILGAYSSADEPLGVTHVRCGNRRADVCPPCSRLYAADMFHLIRAGVSGGKTVPETVAENPLVFGTVTAPSFGLVHGRRDHGPCRPGRPRGPARCPHGRSRTCQARHNATDLIETLAVNATDLHEFSDHDLGAGRVFDEPGERLGEARFIVVDLESGDGGSGGCGHLQGVGYRGGCLRPQRRPLPLQPAASVKVLLLLDGIGITGTGRSSPWAAYL